MGSLIRLLQRPKCRLNRYILHKSSQCVASVSTGRAQSLDPSPSELLRATLLGSVTPPRNNQVNAGQDQRILELLDSKWQHGNPPLSLWYALKGVSSMDYNEVEGRLPSIVTLSSLRDMTDRLVIDKDSSENFQGKIQYIFLNCRGKHALTELLSALGDIIVRLRRLKSPIDPELYELGLALAAQNLSSTAFNRHLTNLLEIDPNGLSGDKGFEIVQFLSGAVRQELFEVPFYDTTHILAEVTGEHDTVLKGRNFRLHDILHSKFKRNRDLIKADLQSWTNYLCLLSTLQSDGPLTTLWKKLLDLNLGTSEKSMHLMYSVVLDLIRAGRSETASQFLEDISIRNGDKLQHLKTFKYVQEILDDSLACETLEDVAGKSEYQQLCQVALKNTERRLGIQWKEPGELLDLGDESHLSVPAEGAHVSITQGTPWSVFIDRSLLTIDGDCAGYDWPGRLLAELEASGCSRSPNQLGKIVELLHDLDGNHQLAVLLEGYDQPSFPKFRWCPQHSPIEFSHSQLPASTDYSREWTPASLGLIWARPLINGVPQTRGESFHLMQLGSLDMQRGPRQAWQPSGYIVGWDRQSGHMKAVFVGTDHGVIDRGIMPSNAPFGTVIRIRCPEMPDSGRWTSVDPFHLDLDPSPDLGFR